MKQNGINKEFIKKDKKSHKQKTIDYVWRLSYNIVKGKGDQLWFQ